MIRSTILTGIMTLAIIFFAGCSGHDNRSPNEPSTKDIYSMRIGANAIEKNKVNIVALSKENTMTFQFLKDFDSASFFDYLATEIELVNASSGCGYVFTNTDFVNNGNISTANNEYGGVATYTATDSLSSVYIPGGGSFNVSPGDKLVAKVGFIGVKFTDGTDTLLRDDELTIYCSADMFTRSVGTDDLDTGGVIESIKLGDFTLTDKDVNLIPLGSVREINVDFQPQLNPFKFKDLLDFRIVINNMFTNRSYIVERASLDENGEFYVVDYARGLVKYRLYQAMDKVIIGGIEFTPASPGDLIEIRIDYFNDEDIQENPLKWQNKRFRILFIS